MLSKDFGRHIACKETQQALLLVMLGILSRLLICYPVAFVTLSLINFHFSRVFPTLGHKMRQNVSN